jgi:hypothetical protein
MPLLTSIAEMQDEVFFLLFLAMDIPIVVFGIFAALAIKKCAAKYA